MPDLKMYALPGISLPEYTLPDGYCITNYSDPADKAAWVECCKNGLLGDDATVDAFEHSITRFPDIIPERDVYFIDYQGEHVGTFTAFLYSENQVGLLHMVAIRPEHRGKGLSRVMGPIACRHLFARGAKWVQLVTDSWRISAVRSYLRAGFVPVEYKENTVLLWEKLLAELQWPLVPLLNEDGEQIALLSPAVSE